jgi:raffinose/stachyose/melibiose transport system permease protein
MVRTIRSILHRFGFFFLTTPALVLYSFFVLYPVMSGFYYSLTDWNGISRKIHYIGLRNFIRMFHDERLLNSLSITLFYTLCSTVTIMLLALLLAVLLHREMKMRLLFRAIFFFPAVLSLILVAIVFNNIYSFPLPAIGKALGIPSLSKSLLSGSHSAIYGIMIVNLWQGTSIPFVIFLAGLQAIPVELLESASLEGARSFQVFRRIQIPFLIPSFQVVVTLLLRQGLTTFDYVKALTDGGPGYSTETLPILIYGQAFGGRMSFSYAITESILLFLLMCFLSVMQFRFITRMGIEQL